MNRIKRIVNQSRHKQGFFNNLCLCAGFSVLLVCLVSLPLGAEETETDGQPSSTDTSEIQRTEDIAEQKGTAEKMEKESSGKQTAPEVTKEIITGTSKRMESYEREGITILIDEAKTVRRNEQGIEIGFLNADKITLKRDLETGTTKEIVAEGNVEIRDRDIFATCDHAIMNNLTSTLILKDNVVVLQNKDRLETKFFTFNRITGKQTAEGDVKFKVTVTQAPIDSEETGENTESSTGAGEEQTSPTATQETGEEPQNKDAGNAATPEEVDTGNGTPEDTGPE